MPMERHEQTNSIKKMDYRNMKGIFLAAALAAVFTTGCWAQQPTSTAKAQIWDTRNHPEDYYLQDGQQPSSVALLPAPPEPGSLLFLYDEARYKWGKQQRNTPRGAQAVADARLNGEDLSRAFSEAFGCTISRETTPELYRLMQNMREDAGDLGTRETKRYYMRVRPYVFYGDTTSVRSQEESHRHSGSYPSGHTAMGWAEALVLAEINVDRQDEILKRGYEIGQSRVIAGYHWQSDVNAARLMGSAVVARLHADSKFQAQLEKAKKEFARLKKAGKIAPKN